jgi:hypothetical protein
MNGEEINRVSAITNVTKELVRQSKRELESYRRSSRRMEKALEASRQQLRDSLAVKYRLIHKEDDE